MIQCIGTFGGCLMQVTMHPIPGSAWPNQHWRTYGARAGRKWMIQQHAIRDNPTRNDRQRVPHLECSGLQVSSNDVAVSGFARVSFKSSRKVWLRRRHEIDAPIVVYRGGQPLVADYKRHYLKRSQGLRVMAEKYSKVGLRKRLRKVYFISQASGLHT